jgi:hypothetical protein
MSVCLYICLPERRFYPFTITFSSVYQHQRLLLRGNSFSVIRIIVLRKRGENREAERGKEQTKALRHTKQS